MKRLMVVKKAIVVFLLFGFGCTRERIVYVNMPTPVSTPTPAPSATCGFPQGLNYETFPATPALYAELNAAMSAILDCPVESECRYPTYDPQDFYRALTRELQSRGLCAGQPVIGQSDEIAVGRTRCGTYEIWHAWNYNGRPLWARPRENKCVGTACGNPFRGGARPLGCS